MALDIDILISRGDDYFLDGKYGDSMECYGLVLKIYPASIKARNRVGMLNRIMSTRKNYESRKQV